MSKQDFDLKIRVSSPMFKDKDALRQQMFHARSSYGKFAAVATDASKAMRRFVRSMRKAVAWQNGKTLNPSPSHVELVFHTMLLTDTTHHLVQFIANDHVISQRDAARLIVRTMLRWGVNFERARWLEYLKCDDPRPLSRKSRADMLRKHHHWPMGRMVKSLVWVDTLAFEGEWQYLTGRVAKHDRAYGDACLVDFGEENGLTRIVPFRNLKPVWGEA